MSHSYLGQSGNMTFKKQISDTLLKNRSTIIIKSLSNVFQQPYFWSPEPGSREKKLKKKPKQKHKPKNPIVERVILHKEKLQ